MREALPPWHRFPQVGEPGFTEEETDFGRILFLRSADGELLAVIEFYTKTGDIGLQTSPWYLRQGHMSKLMDEAQRRWPTLDARRQNYNAGGQAFIKRYFQKRGEPHDITPRR
jgi:hypothetical protein